MFVFHILVLLWIFGVAFGKHQYSHSSNLVYGRWTPIDLWGDCTTSSSSRSSHLQQEGVSYNRNQGTHLSSFARDPSRRRKSIHLGTRHNAHPSHHAHVPRTASEIHNDDSYYSTSLYRGSSFSGSSQCLPRAQLNVNQGSSMLWPFPSWSSCSSPSSTGSTSWMPSLSSLSSWFTPSSWSSQSSFSSFSGHQYYPGTYCSSLRAQGPYRLYSFYTFRDMANLGLIYVGRFLNFILDYVFLLPSTFLFRLHLFFLRFPILLLALVFLVAQYFIGLTKLFSLAFFLFLYPLLNLSSSFAAIISGSVIFVEEIWTCGFLHAIKNLFARIKAYFLNIWALAKAYDTPGLAALHALFSFSGDKACKVFKVKTSRRARSYRKKRQRHEEHVTVSSTKAEKTKARDQHPVKAQDNAKSESRHASSVKPAIKAQPGKSTTSNLQGLGKQHPMSACLIRPVDITALPIMQKHIPPGEKKGDIEKSSAEPLGECPFSSKSQAKAIDSPSDLSDETEDFD